MNHRTARSIPLLLLKQKFKHLLELEDHERLTSQLKVVMSELSTEELDDILRGLVLAFLAITDDKPQTLQKVGKANPWQIEALKIITGNEERAHLPLSEILQEQLSLVVDAHIDVRGITKGGQLLDTQGYIAHNDEIIVLAYRCTTSFFDWIANLNTTTSAWEVEEDLEIGFSGYCSCLEGLCCTRNPRPRVHTGFYNNFLAPLPLIKQHIEPLLGPDQPPRKLYVTGHSLGAGIATLASCYFLLDFDWNTLPQSFCSVTAGSPRGCGVLMQEQVHNRLAQLDASKVRAYRLVKGKDVVARVPPTVLGFRHIGPAIIIESDGSLRRSSDSLTLPRVDSTSNDADATTTTTKGLQSLVRGVPQQQPGDDEASTGTGPDSSRSSSKTKYEKFISRFPEPLRDHMPEFYLKPVYQAKGLDIPASGSPPQGSDS